MNNEYLSNERWEKLHDAIAEVITPVTTTKMPGDLEEMLLTGASEYAAYILSDLGIMPESARDDEKTHIARKVSKLVLERTGNVTAQVQVNARKFVEGELAQAGFDMKVSTANA